MSATIPDLNQPCPNCDHPLKFHDPEDGSCDVFSGDYKIGACPCGRPSKSVARRLPDDQVAWYAGTSRTAKWSAEMSTRVDLIALAREVHERRAADTRTPSFTDDEMEAIRLVLLYATAMDRRERAIARLGKNVAAWVLGDPSPAPCETCGGQCRSRGPRIGNEGCPLCILPSGHEGSHQGDPSWGQNMQWGAPDMILPCPSCGGEK